MRLHLGHGGTIVLASLMIDGAGFMCFGRLHLMDGFLNACMLLGGIGPVGDLGGTAGKIFASLFALYAGLVASLILAPVSIGCCTDFTGTSRSVISASGFGSSSAIDPGTVVSRGACGRSS